MLQLNSALKSTCVFLLLAGASTISQAQNYIGLGIGQSSFDIEGQTLSEDEDTAGALFIGRDFTRSISGEIYYHDLGTAEISGSGSQIDITATGLSLIYALPYNTETWSVYARLGAAHLTGSSSTEEVDDDTEIGYGIGLRWNMHENWFSRLEYRGYGSDHSAVFLTAAYAFGGDSKPVEEKPVAVIEEKAEIIEEVVVEVDSDNDGINDLADKCPGTSSDIKVDEAGCPVVITTEAKQAILETIDLKSVNFKSNSKELTPSSISYLDTAAVALKANSSINLEVQAYTDSGGAESYNLELSEKRAQSVKQYLVEQGIDASRLQAKGYGEANPIADNTTAAGRAENRRVEFKVID